MLFNSPVFLFAFLPSVLLVYLFLENRARAWTVAAFLATSSLVFYSWWNPAHLPLLLASITFNFWFGQIVSPESSWRQKESVLIFAIAANIFLLGLFKYADFAIETYNRASGSHYEDMGLVLPLAISFFTFQQIAYLVDSYRGQVAEKGFVSYTMFVTFFPHLIAVPIVHHSEMMPQFARLAKGRRRSAEEIWSDLAAGFVLFIIGLSKKVLFADQFGIWANNAFRLTEAGGRISAIEAWLGVACFTLQIYLDFSAYTDMALGLSRLFGVRLPLNFNSPYKATSLIEFWRRWHMTLSRFLRDYIYVPLGGARKGDLRKSANLLIVMLVGGLWHGAAWTFVLWGAIHGILLVINHAYRSRASLGWPTIPTWLGRALTLLAVMMTWIFFRSETVAGAMNMLYAFVGGTGIALPIHWEPMFGAYVASLAAAGLDISFRPMTAYSGGYQVFWVVTGLLAVLVLPNSQEILNFDRPVSRLAPMNWIRDTFAKPSALTGVLGALLLLWSAVLIMQGQAGEFIYFQF